jgi:hypothetical protein
MGVSKIPEIEPGRATINRIYLPASGKSIWQHLGQFATEVRGGGADIAVYVCDPGRRLRTPECEVFRLAIHRERGTIRR